MQDFADLIVYTASVPRFIGFEHARLNNKCWEMTSFGESRATQFANDSLLSMAVVEYNKKQNRHVYSDQFSSLIYFCKIGVK
jgi:hypothetical protein